MPTTQINIQTRADLAALNLTAKSFNVLSQQEQSAEKQTLALAQQMARLDASMKQPAAGALRLKAALQNATYIDPAQGIQALSQITQLERQATVEADKLAKATKGLGTNNGLAVLPRTVAGLSGEALTAAKSFIVLQAANKGLDFIKTGASVADVTRSFNSLSVAAGTTGDALLTSLRTASLGTITDASLIKDANLGLLLTQGQIAKSLPQLTQIAIASAKATGQSVDFIFESLVRGISRGSAKIIDNAGITLDGEAAFNDYAASIGKSADQLTKAEQQQAVTNAVLKTGAQIVKDVGINAEDSSVKIAQAQTAIENLGTAISARISPYAGRVAEGVANAINKGDVNPGETAQKDATQATLIARATSFDDYTARVAAVNDQLGQQLANNPVDVWLDKQFLGLRQVTPAQFAYAQSLIATGAASAVALQQAQQLTEVDALFTKALNSATTFATGARTELTALAPKIFEVANLSDHNKVAVQGLLTAYAAGTQTLPGLIEALAGLAQGHDIARLAAQEEARENRRLGISFTDLIPQADAAAVALNKLIKLRSSEGIGSGRGGGSDAIGEGDAFVSFLKTQNDDRKKAADEAARLADALFDNDLKRAKDNAAKIALLRGKLGKTTDPIERAQIEGRIIDLQNQKNTGLAKEQNLQESIYDSIAKQKAALLDIEELTIKDRQQDRDDVQKAKTARAIIKATEGRTDARALDFRARAQDDLALIDVKDRQRAADIAQKQTTAGGTISASGKLLQSVQGGGAVAPAGATDGAAAAPTQAPQPATAPAAANGSVMVNVIIDGKTAWSGMAPYAWTDIVRAAQGVA